MAVVSEKTALARLVAAVPRHAYLDAIAELTATRDSHALAIALVENIRRFTTALNVRLLVPCNANNDREFVGSTEDLAVRDMLAGTDPTDEGDIDVDDLRVCITDRRAVRRRRGDGERQLIPVHGVRYLSGVLSVDGPALSTSERELIDYLLRIYSNQFVLMDKGESDALTGLLNRQSFDARMRKVMNGEMLVGRNGQSAGMSFAIIDIDYFKHVNDTFGHLFGDEVLLLMARLMTRTFRQSDMLFRYGGEEFAVLLTEKLDKALIGVERFRAAVEAYEFPQIGHKTVSIGVVEIAPGELLSSVIDKADKALYYAKYAGRNRIGVYEHLREKGLVGEAQNVGGDVELF